MNKCEEKDATIDSIKRNVHGKTTFANIIVEVNEQFIVGFGQDQLKREGINIRVFKQAHKVRSF